MSTIKKTKLEVNTWAYKPGQGKSQPCCQQSVIFDYRNDQILMSRCYVMVNQAFDINNNAYKSTKKFYEPKIFEYHGAHDIKKIEGSLF